EEKLHIAAQIEDEARHTVFFDRFYREVVGLKGDNIMDILDASFPWVAETFVGPFGLLAYQADEVRRNPYDERARVPAGVLHRFHRDLPGRVAARPGRHEVPAGRGAQGPEDDQRDPRHAAHDPLRVRGQQPRDLLRASGL